MMKIFSWKIEFYFDITEWGIPFGFGYVKIYNYVEISFAFLCFGVVFEKDT